MKATRFYTLMLVFLLCAMNALASVSARVDRSDIGIDESFTLTISAKGSVSGAPDLAPLEREFQIIGSSTSNQISIINGKETHLRQWLVNLMPKHAGKLTIPALNVGKDTTKAIELTIEKISDKKEGRTNFLEASVSPTAAYVGSPIIYTVKLVYRNQGLVGNLPPPQLENVNMQALDQGSNYQSRIGGKIYNVFERRYMLFPQSAGQLVIPPSFFEGRESAQRQGSNSPFFQFGPTKLVRLRSEPITIEIKPIPDIAKSHHWLPARDVQLTQQWSGEKGQEWQVGQPVTRILSLKAVDVAGDALPEFKLTRLDHVNTYPEKPKVNTMTDGTHLYGTRTEHVVYIPTEAGDLSLPALKVNWWNTITKKMEVASLPPLTVTVKPAAKTVASTAVQNAGKATPLTPMTQAIQAVEQSVDKEQSALWQRIAALFAMLWFITLVLWFLHVRRHRTLNDDSSTQRPRHKKSLKSVQRDVKLACEQHDITALHHNLIAWAKTQWPGQAFNTLGDILAQPLAPEFNEALGQLDEALYRDAEDEYNFNHFMQSFKAQLKWHPRMGKQAKKEDLPPLHPE